MRKRIIIFITALVLFFLGCSNDKEDKVKNNQEKKRYVVAINLEQPPLLYKDYETGEEKGFIYDVAKEIEKRGEFVFCWEEVPISRIFDEVTEGNYDIGIAPFISIEERKEKVNITYPFYNSSILILGNRAIDYSKNTKFIYGVQSESSAIKKISDEDKGKIIINSKEERLVTSLKNRDIDYLVIDDACGKKILRENPELFQKEIVEEVEVSFITSKTMNKDDFKRINEIILELKADGTIEKLKKKYGI